MAQQSDDGGRFGRAPGGRGPQTPTDLDATSWKNVARRTWREFRDDDLTDWAAALTYYGVLSLFPALLVLVSILGLLGGNLMERLIENLGGVTPGPAREIALSAVENLQDSQVAGVMAAVGVALALWSASNYVGAFTRASNAIYEMDEGRPFYKLKPLQLGITLVVLLLIAACALAVVVTGPLAETIGGLVGVGDVAVTAWDIAKWPVIALVFMTMLAFLYYAAPNVRHPRFRWVSPGSVVAVVVWLLASAAFAVYVANFGSYDKVYGSLGGVIAFLTWLWISNVAVLLGAEINAEAERGRQIERGVPPDREPFLAARDTTKFDKERAAR